jgi:hypothetical protein
MQKAADSNTIADPLHNKAMSYSEEYFALKKVYDAGDARISIPERDAEILNLPFESKSSPIHPGEGEYRCDDHYRYFVSYMETNREFSSPPLHEILFVLNSDIPKNWSFSYPLFKRQSTPKASGVIILVHGLNEKSWDKYLPWAGKFLELTGKAVLLFPIAFHMNRVPREWSKYRLMTRVFQYATKFFQ